MSQTSIRVDNDGQFAFRCTCKRSTEPAKPNLIATCPVTISLSSASSNIPLKRHLAVYDTGYIILAEDREDCSVLSCRDIVLFGIDLLDSSIHQIVTPGDQTYSIIAIRDLKGHLLTECMIGDKVICGIILVAVQQAVKQAQMTRSSDVVYAATVHEGLVLLQKTYIVLLKNRMFALGTRPTVGKNPKKEAKLFCLLDDVDFKAYGKDGRGIEMKKKNVWIKGKAIHFWFSKPEERAEFFALITFNHMDFPDPPQCTGANLMKSKQVCSHQILKAPEEISHDAGDVVITVPEFTC